jgi:lysophospholipase L1-like esterase
MRRLLAVAAAAAGTATALAAGSSAAAADYPDSMASTGDSITRGFNAGLIPWTDAPRTSWSTGSSPYVQSHYRRILAANPLIFGRNFNDARSGAEMEELEHQFALVNLQRVEYVTVLMGANDACASSEAAMTPVAEFRAQFEAAMRALARGSPQARVFVASIPDVHRLWLILHANPNARWKWRLTGFCRSMLANPGSTAPADMARRERVRERIVAYNTVLAEVCGLYVRCRFDGNAVFEYPFQPQHVSTRDYFHPSLEGQRVLAKVTWRATFDFAG